jgi:ABC-2 type transport system permease protein
VYFGRALPVIANAFVVSAFALVAAAFLFDIHLAAGSWALLALCIVVGAWSATGLGLVSGAICLRGREAAVLGNVFALVLLLFCGATVPIHTLPAWMQDVSHVIPLTHAIAAAREAASGASFGAVSSLLGTELGIGAVYGAIGIAMLYGFETSARRGATIDLI